MQHLEFLFSWEKHDGAVPWNGQVLIRFLLSLSKWYAFCGPSEDSLVLPPPSNLLCALFMLTKTYATPSLIFKRENEYHELSFNYFAFFKCITGTKVFFFVNYFPGSAPPIVAVIPCKWKLFLTELISYFPLQERSRSSVSLRAATEGLQTAVTERSTCTFTRRTSLICARCVTSHTHIPALSGNTWR